MRADREQLRQEIIRVLRAEGGDPGNSIHSWRCEYPERYGECDCVAALAALLLSTIDIYVQAEQRALLAAMEEKRVRRDRRARREAWNEGFESGATWSPRGPSGVPSDPPTNPYHRRR